MPLQRQPGQIAGVIGGGRRQQAGDRNEVVDHRKGRAAAHLGKAGAELLFGLFHGDLTQRFTFRIRCNSSVSGI